IEKLKEMQPDTEVIYVGRKNTMEDFRGDSVESKLLPTVGVKYKTIIAGRLQRSFSIYTIPSLLKIPIGVIQALNIIFSEKPDVILSFGGYVAVPVVFTGWLFSIPIIVHEQTLVSGLANKISSLFADKVALSFDEGSGNNRVIYTGNPIRKEIVRPIEKLPAEFSNIFKRAKEDKLPVILVMGGNQGSHLINITLEKVLGNITEIAYVIHVSGDNKFADFERLKKVKNERYIVKKWIGREIGKVLEGVDLVISRAGANTLTELSFLGKPTLAIPLQMFFQNEQMKNAEFFESAGLVRVLPQSKLSGGSLLENVKAMIKDLERLTLKATEAKKVINKDAAQRLALETILLKQKK
ncbi:UDP-N-acetylglucosamine--N-acetylmuramyl-(pentapeptide) pyrophosphoryl-undecaprenol N-acetylglucosamine transferase, partial [Candidatus Daviesbacteria bacterium]|nr:UDP-N-acetylglucosamine--N-acetylmuramyl-(pentapeptide) pyrophosphoryl-undecaprenol N-acetylglucosamine transferase [Candidatus Daviesbacteria bacterium]